MCWAFRGRVLRQLACAAETTADSGEVLREYRVGDMDGLQWDVPATPLRTIQVL